MIAKLGRYLTNLLVLIILAACTPDGTRLETPRPETVPSTLEKADITRIPDDISHTWRANPVLITLEDSAGFTSYEYAWALSPDLIVYADGTIIYSIWSQNGNDFAPTYYTAQIPNSELCNLLLEIEDTGFFELSQSDYQEPEITDNGTTFIDINSWRSKSFAAYALDYAVSKTTLEDVEISSALKETYELLRDYHPQDASLYQPDEVLLFIDKVNYAVAAELWPLSEIDLGEIAENTDEEREIVLEGAEAATISAMYSNVLTKYFEVDGEIYSVTVRPIFPLETLRRTNGWGRLSTFESSPKVEMNCPGEIIEAPTPEIDPTTPAPTAVIENSSREPSSLVAPLEFIGEVGARNAPGQINFSAALIGTPDGNILVADPGNDRFQLFALDGSLLDIYPLLDSSPQSMAFGPEGNLVVANWWNNVVERRSPTGETLLETYADWPDPDDGVNDPTDHIDLMAVGPDGRIYTGERSGNRVVVLNPDGSFLGEWRGQDGISLESVWDLGTDDAGNLYIIDRELDLVIKRLPDDRIERISFNSGMNIAVRPDGSFFAADENTIAFFDSSGSKVTDWTENDFDIRDMAVATDGSVIIQSGSLFEETEPVFLRYDEEGNLLTTFGTTRLQPGQFESHLAFSVSPVGDTWVVTASRDGLLQLVHIDPQDNHLNTYRQIGDQPLTCYDYSIVALADQSVIVGDSCQGTILHLDSAGEIIGQWGERGTAPGQINLLSDLALSPDGQSMYLADSANGRITHYTFNGEPLDQWDAAQLDVRQPKALAVAGDGTFFIIDGAAGEVVVRPSEGDGSRWQLPVAGETPNDIAVDEARHRIYVGGSDINLYVFDYNGKYLGRTRVSDSSGVMVNVGPDGNVYRSTGYEEIQVFRPTE